MAVLESLTYETILKSLQDELQKAQLLYYVPDKAIIIGTVSEKEIIPTFEKYCIRISTPDSGWLIKNPKIGWYYKNDYAVAIELWVKSSGKLAQRLTSGSISVNKGIYEFLKDVIDILEHNTLDGQLHPYAGSSIGPQNTIKTDDKETEGIMFFWYGTQLNKS